MKRNELIDKILYISQQDIRDEDKQEQIKDLIKRTMQEETMLFTCEGCKKELSKDYEDTPSMCMRCSKMYEDMKAEYDERGDWDK